MKNDKFLQLVQKRLANTSVGASTARGMPKNTVSNAQDFLRKVHLADFAVTNEQDFNKVLKKYTNALVNDLWRKSSKTDKGKSLPSKKEYWGMSRKFLNIYLREILYNKYLSPVYKFDKIQNYLELPLDSHVAEGLRNEEKVDGKKRLSRWQSIKGLNSKTNREYQQFASEVAEKKQTCRIHLDLLYWRSDEKKKTRS